MSTSARPTPPRDALDATPVLPGGFCFVGLAWIPATSKNVQEPERVLLLQLTDASVPQGSRYQLPGGEAQSPEPDWKSMQWHVWRTTGLEVTPTAILGQDWPVRPPAPGLPMVYRTIYLCEPVAAGTRVTLPGGEPGLVAHRWVSRDEGAALMRGEGERAWFYGLWDAWGRSASAVQAAP
ncbi:hypothetical protein ACFP1Z_24835 [Streptomyces gamaensis]|uniref:NUDIX hydrolase n=1 Tax=Streptomyces gamaensis TaxID=1763542 RepID=A0ABW0Z8L2_9ACTN